MKLALRVKKALENNSINFANKTVIFFDYYILANNKITFELQGNRITIANTEAFVIEPFEHKELDFKLMAFLPQIWELKESVCSESSIIQGNLRCPTLDINGITLQNWTDKPIFYAAGQILYSIEVEEEPETILVGNIKSEIDMRSIFKNWTERNSFIEFM